MKSGVSASACGVRSTPARAFEPGSCDSTVNVTADIDYSGMLYRLVGGIVEFQSSRIRDSAYKAVQHVWLTFALDVSEIL